MYLLFSECKFHQYLSLDTSKLLAQYRDQPLCIYVQESAKAFQGKISSKCHKLVAGIWPHLIGKRKSGKFYCTTMPVRFARKFSLVKYFHHTVVKALFRSCNAGCLCGVAVV